MNGQRGLLWAVAALVVATTALALLLVSSRESVEVTASSGVLTSARSGSAATQVVEPARAAVTRPFSGEEAATALPVPDDWEELSGRVFDPSGQPLPGAEVGVFPPSRRALAPGARSQPTWWYTDDEGGLTCGIDPTSGPAGVLRAGAGSLLDPEVWLGRRQILRHVRPAPGARPLRHVVTDAEGRFTLPCHPAGVLLRASHERHLATWLRTEPDQAVCEMTLQPALVLRGRLTDAEGRGLGDHGLAFLALGGAAAWEASSSVDGRFELAVGTAWVVPRSTETTWSLAWPVKPVESGCADVQLVAKRLPFLRVKDSGTGKPVEDIRYTGSLAGTDRVVRSGAGRSADGCFPLAEHHGELVELGKMPLTINVWSPEHAPATVRINGLSAVEEIPVELERGASVLGGRVSVLGGRVLRSGAPVQDAVIALRLAPPRDWRRGWQPAGLRLLDSTRSDEHGTFRMPAPAGRYVLDVACGDVSHAVEVVHPVPGLVEIDLGRLGSVLVDVRSKTTGASVPGVSLVMRRSGAREIHGLGDGAGRVVFRGLDAGSFTVALPPSDRRAAEPLTGSLVAGQELRLDLEVGEPATGVVHLVVKGAPGPKGWLAREEYRDPEWRPVGEDGRLPLDLTAGGFVGVKSPDGQTWVVRVPPQPAPGHRVVVNVTGRGFRGVLVDAATSRPLAGVKLSAWPDELGAAGASCTTDAHGAFELLGLDAVRYRLLFEGSFGVAGMSFRPARAAAEPAVELRVELPGRTRSRTETLVTGTVTARGGEAPVAGAWVSVSGLVETAGGELTISAAQATAKTDEEGRYQVRAPGVGSYVASVTVQPSRAEEAQPSLVFRWKADGDHRRDFTVE